MEFNTGLNDDLVIAANWVEEYQDPEKYKKFCMNFQFNKLCQGFEDFVHHQIQTETVEIVAEYYMKQAIFVPCCAAIAAAHLITFKKLYAARVAGIFNIPQLLAADVVTAVSVIGGDREETIVVEPPSSGDLDKLRRQKKDKDITKCVKDFANQMRALLASRHKKEVSILATGSLGQLDDNLWEKAIAGSYLVVYEKHYMERAKHIFSQYSLTEMQLRQAMKEFAHL